MSKNIDIEIYRSMGYLDGILPDRIDFAVEQYKELTRIAREEKDLIKAIIFNLLNVDEWWNSYLPIKVVEGQLFDMDTAINILFDVLHRILINSDKEITINEILIALASTYINPFDYIENEDFYLQIHPSYEKLFEVSSSLITKMCFLNFSINKVLLNENNY